MIKNILITALMAQVIYLSYLMSETRQRQLKILNATIDAIENLDYRKADK